MHSRTMDSNAGGSTEKSAKKAKRSKKEKPLEEVSTLIIDINPCHRYTLLVLNLIIMLFSGIITAGSVYSLIMRWNDFMLIRDPILLNLLVNLEIPYLILGSLAFIMSAIGFIGTLRENLALLQTYNSILTFLLIVDLVLGFTFVGVPFFARGSIKGLFSTQLIIHYRDNEDFQGLVDYVQARFQCCGVTTKNFRDWNMNVYFNCTKDNPSSERCSVPSSCCRVSGDDPAISALTHRFCGGGVLAMTDYQAWNVVYVRNCVDTMVAVIRKNGIFLATIVIAVLMALIIVGSMVSNVISELNTLTKVYKKYYKAVAKGLKKKLAKLEAMEDAPEGYLVDLGSPGRERKKPVAVALPKDRKCVQPCRTPGTEFDRAISYGAIPQIGAFCNERARLLASWDCPRHNVRKYSHVYDPNCAACCRMEGHHTPGTPRTPHKGHHVEHDPL
ncbi:tetraspanin-33-like isoform X2 [Ornithodoros turicata]|uniref:tetraspanin-33-like isoform X2 n=1 Tax=Ornithodoros turicata TaxID=34597 RepID=UPI0031395B15